MYQNEIDETRRLAIIGLTFKSALSWRPSGSQVSLFSWVQKGRNYSPEHEVDAFADKAQIFAKAIYAQPSADN